jgi:hypothetical protein
MMRNRRQRPVAYNAARSPLATSSSLCIGRTVTIDAVVIVRTAEPARIVGTAGLRLRVIA